jgi:hypothetical protein
MNFFGQLRDPVQRRRVNVREERDACEERRDQ